MIQRGKDVFAVCPCGRESLVLAFVDGGAFCPACAPTPDKKPHDYKPVSGCDPRGAYLMRRGMYEELRADISPEFLKIPSELLKAYDDAMKATDESIRTHALAAVAIRNGVCCLDPGDCNGPCELV